MIALVIAILQVPHAVHQVSGRSNESVPGVVIGGAGLARSWTAFSRAFNVIEVRPWQVPLSAWLLVACGAVVTVKYWRDAPLLAVTLVPPVAAILGYAVYVGDFPDSYLSLMPASVITLLLGVTAVPSKRAAQILSVAAFAASVAVVPARLRFAHTMHRMPEYGPLLDGSRKIARRAEAMRGIRTDFSLPPTSDPEFLYTILGGRLDRAAPWVALIKSDGSVVYQRVGGV
jgi:hypothetical protein